MAVFFYENLHCTLVIVNFTQTSIVRIPPESILDLKPVL